VIHKIDSTRGDTEKGNTLLSVETILKSLLAGKTYFSALLGSLSKYIILQKRASSFLSNEMKTIL
jgi:hypothetical protein